MKELCYILSLLIYCLTTCTMDVIKEPKPVFFDALEPIISYNGKALATIHPAYKKKAQQDATFSLVVPVIQHYRTIDSDNYHFRLIRFYTSLVLDRKQDTDVKAYMKVYGGDTYYTEPSEVTVHDFVYHVKKLCKYFCISPQTSYAVKQTYRHLVHGHYVDLTDPRLAYIDAQEEHNKNTLAKLLPPTLNMLLASNYEYYRVNFIKPIFYKMVLQRHDKQFDLSSNIRSLALDGEHNLIISPQSVVKAMEEYHALLDGHTIMPYTPYDRNKELAQLMEIGNQFPAELPVQEETITTYHYKTLVFQAFALQHPQHKNMLTENHYHRKKWSIVYHIGTIIDPSYWYRNNTTYDQMRANPIVQEFIDTFTSQQQTN